MRAALKTRDGRFDVTDVPVPALPADDWVRMRVRVAGICGTDLRHWEKPEPDLECRIMGHELAGEIEAVGAGVTRLKPGDRVVVETVLGCGHCAWCNARQYNLCPDLYPTRMESVSRAYAEYVVGPQHKFYHLPDSIGFDDAALIDTYSVCLHAHHLSGLTIGDRVAIIGAGPIGLGQLMLAKAGGADAIVIDRHDAALALARRLGADATGRADGDPVAAVRDFAGGRGADIVFECAGGTSMPTTLPQATRMARRGGAVVIVGGFDAGDIAIPLPWQDIQKGEIRLISSASFAMRGIELEERRVLDLIARGKLQTQPLITHRFPLERINDAFACAAAKAETGAIFVAIEP